MKYNKIKKWGLVAIFTPLLLLSCTEEFLDTELTGLSTSEVYYSSVDGLSQLAIGSYAVVNTCPANIMNLDMMYIAFGSIASDEAEAGGELGGGDKLDFQHWDQGVPQPTEVEALSENNWGYTYKTITRANTTLEGIAFYRNENSSIPADSAAILSRLEGEMEFLVAFSHFKLTQIYGGVPIVDHILGGDEYNISRNTVAECLHFVQERLEIAIDLLPTRSEYPSADMGRATKGAAEALLAKAYLYESSYAENYAGDARFTGCENKYNLALIHAENVINSGEYTLLGINGETFDTYWNQNGSTLYPESTPGYRYIFSVQGRNSPEILFSTQAFNDGLNYMLSRGTYLTIYTTTRNTDVGTLGWGFNCPTEKLRDKYEDGDLRKIVTIAETNDPVYLGSNGWAVLDCRTSPTNMMGRKYEAGADEFWENRTHESNGPSSFPYIRYGDVVLLAAEAAIKTNDAGKALTYVNMIRKRARNGASTGAPADLSAASFDDVVNERLLELALEGHRFFDLVRWGKQELIIGQPLREWSDGEPQASPVLNDFTLGVNEFFPIPLTEVINSNNNLVQYPGYQ